MRNIPGNAGRKAKAPWRGIVVIGAATEAELAERLRFVHRSTESGRAPSPAAVGTFALQSPERVAIDYGNPSELADKSAKALNALDADQPMIWKALRAQGIFRGRGPAPKVVFLYPGQGSQYANMLRRLCAAEPIVAETFAEADSTMAPLLGKPLSEFLFVDETTSVALRRVENDLLRTEITQPAVLTVNIAMTRLLAAYGIRPDFTVGHSLGEYGALVAAGAISFADALQIVSLQAPELRQAGLRGSGKMAAVLAPPEEVKRVLKAAKGYVVIANVNSNHQAVIGGAPGAVQKAMDLFLRAGYEAVPLPVTHAFHTALVDSLCEPLRRTLQRIRLTPPRVPTVSSVDGQFYPTGPDAMHRMAGTLERHVASPVEFVNALDALYAAGARVFVEVGPKKALQGFADDVLGQRPDVVSIFTNHPKLGDFVSFNHALCGLYAAGLGTRKAEGISVHCIAERGCPEVAV
jgi:acyl transferase domain-containing protein